MSNHDSLLKQAMLVQSKTKDYLDQHGHEQARRVTNEINGLISDLRGKKPGSHIDNRLKAVIRYFEELEEEVMDFRHSNLLSGWCEEMRRETRSL